MATAAKRKPAAQPAPKGPTWATVTTLKEPPRRVMEFVAQHLYLGASEIWLYFDDPEDPAIPLVSKIPQVRAIPCTEAHRAAVAPRTTTHEARQKANANHAYTRSQADWMIHLDADEMVHADRPIPALLAEATGEVIRLAPYEQMFYHKAAVNGRPDHYFHGALPNTRKGRVASKALYGGYFKALSHGLLSHAIGKHFVRTGAAGMELSIHAPFRDKLRAEAEEAPQARLLHFHGGDWDSWRAHLERRLTSGAYIEKFGKGKTEEDNLYLTLQALKDSKGEDGLRQFWQTVCTYGPEKRMLRKHEVLFRCNLWLDAKVNAAFGTPSAVSNAAQDPETGVFEAEALWEGVKLRVIPDDNYTERLIARGEVIEADEIETFRSLVKGRKVLFYDIGGNAGIFSLIVAKAAKATSKIIAFEPNPEMQRRFARNVALNGMKNITIRPVALGDVAGKAFLSIVKAGNLGQATLRDTAEGQGHSVPIKRLTDEMLSPAGYDLTLMKIDVEGHEPGVLAPLLDPARKKGHWPDIIMLEHTSAAHWGTDLIGALIERGYTEHHKTNENTFLKRDPKG